MFNTFGSESQDLTSGKRERIQMKQRLHELNNLSTIQLNPWNDDNSKSPLYFDNQNFPNFPKPCLKNAAVIKYAIPRQEAKRQSNKNSLNRQRIDSQNLCKKQMQQANGRKRLISYDSELQRMNKTISVNNFEGEILIGQHESVQPKQKVLEMGEKRHSTTINNPMYGKFCINYNVDKQNVHQRKKGLNEAASSIKFDNLSMKEIIKFRSRMSTLSMDRSGDPERAKSIHEVRRRLKSTSQIMRRKEESQQSLLPSSESSIDKEIFIPIQKEQTNQKKLEYVNLSHVKIISPLIEGERFHQSSSSQKFKLSRRKNLYVGFRKLFAQGLNTRERSFQRKQQVPRQIVNLNALMEKGEGNTIKKFQKFEEYAFQKSFNRNTN